MIRNLHCVSSALWRSGRYSAAGLRALVAETGIRTVVDLRDAHRPLLLAESTYRRLRVDFHRVPLREDEPVPTAAFERVLALVAAAPALVHCWKGAHRTGAIVALYRRLSGWTPETAWEEAQRCGFGHAAAHPSLAAQILDATA